MSDAEKRDGGLTRREFAKTVAAGVAAVAAAHSLSALEAHAAPGSSKMTEAAAGQVSSTGPKEKTAIELISENALKVRFEDLDDQTIKAQKDRLIDLTGCIIGGAMSARNASLVKIVRDMGAKRGSPLVYPWWPGSARQCRHGQLHLMPLERLWSDEHQYRWPLGCCP